MTAQVCSLMVAIPLLGLTDPENEGGTAPALDDALQNREEEDMEEEGQPLTIRRRRPVDPVPPCRRKAYIKNKVGGLKGQVRYTCTGCCQMTMASCVKLLTVPAIATTQ